MRLKGTAPKENTLYTKAKTQDRKYKKWQSKYA